LDSSSCTYRYGKILVIKYSSHPPTKKFKRDLRELIRKYLIKPIKYTTLQLEGYILGESIITLVDNGAINHFIDEAFFLIRNFERVETKEFGITNSKRYQTRCKWMIRDLKLTIENYTIIIDFYVYAMGDFPHIILGFQWLYQLGDVTFNY